MYSKYYSGVNFKINMENKQSGIKNFGSKFLKKSNGNNYYLGNFDASALNDSYESSDESLDSISS
jgi:hypothetical protein